MNNRAGTSEKPLAKAAGAAPTKRSHATSSRPLRAADAHDRTLTPDFEAEVDHDLEGEHRGRG
jgi:hypothetical protein